MAGSTPRTTILSRPGTSSATLSQPSAAHDADDLTWLRLIRSYRVGPVTFHRLIEEYGCAGAALEALPGIARGAGLRDYRPCPAGVAAAELAAGKRAGARLLRHGGDDYPKPLAALPDAPPVLWLRGRSDRLNRPMIALVGARNASSLGLRMARRLARALDEAGFAVVSGLARGIDTAAHEGALPGPTIAVLAGGVDAIYPAENTDLAMRIAGDGGLLSEQPPGCAPQARHFPARNRIIAGLCRAVIVVEAAQRSGSLITARLALEQGREVLAVPGHPLDPRAAGCNLLIREGAVLLRDAEDAIEALGPALATPCVAATPPPGPTPREEPPAAADDHSRSDRGRPAEATPRRRDGRAGSSGPQPHQPPSQVSPSQQPPSQLPAPPLPADPVADHARDIHAAILGRLGASPTAEDQLLRDLALPPARVAQELLALELDGRIERRPGGFLARLH